MRYLLIFIIVFFTACSSKKESFVLMPQNVSAIKTTHIQVGVKKVTLPDYLNSDKILIKDGNRVDELDANFASYPDSLFTQEAIVLLKRKLNDPNVFLYPWDVKEKKGYIVEINIDDYLYSNGYVHLNGTYYIKSANNKTLVSKNFFYKKEALKNPSSIINSLNKLFEELINEIASKIAK